MLPADPPLTPANAAVLAAAHAELDRAAAEAADGDGTFGVAVTKRGGRFLAVKRFRGRRGQSGPDSGANRTCTARPRRR